MLIRPTDFGHASVAPYASVRNFQPCRIASFADQPRFFSLTMADTALPGGATSKANLQSPAVSDGRTSVSVSGVSEDDRRNQKEKPLFSFGAIADVQYADLDDGWNFNKTYRRYYRAALLKLKQAVDVWIRDETHRFVLQLGDVIDGLNSDGHSEAALNTVKQEIDRLAETLPLGVLNSLGNHELYNFSKQRWAREIDCSSFAKAVTLTLGAVPRAAANQKTTVSQADNGAIPKSTNDVITGTEERFYYSFCPHKAFRFVALDTFDLNAICGDGPEGVDLASCSTGVRMLSEKNTNENKSDFAGMDGLERRYVRYNGGVGKEQLSWLEGELHEASLSGQRVIVFGHVPIHPGDTLDHVLLWNYEDVLDVFNRFDCVVAFISGHRHRDTYWVDKGVHHVSLGAVLEAPPDQEAFANVDVYPDRLELRGHGVVASRTMRFPSTPSALAVQTP